MGVDAAHPHLVPLLLVGRSVTDDGADELMAVAEDIGLDVDPVPDAPLRGVTTAVDGGGWELDDDPAGSLAGCLCVGRRRRARLGI
jgi:hypothetical protein